MTCCKSTRIARMKSPAYRRGFRRRPSGATKLDPVIWDLVAYSRVPGASARADAKSSTRCFASRSRAGASTSVGCLGAVS